MSFGSHIKALRAAKKAQSKSKYTVRAVAQRVGVDPSYITLIESGRRVPPNIAAKVVEALAEDLGEDVDVLLAMAGFIRSDLRQAISERPDVFRSCVRKLRRDVEKNAARQVRDGHW